MAEMRAEERSAVAGSYSTILAPYASVASRLTRGAVVGMTIVAGRPSIRHDRATACAWFPDEYASTPRFRSASGIREIALYAPRILNAPMR